MQSSGWLRLRDRESRDHLLLSVLTRIHSLRHRLVSSRQYGQVHMAEF